MYRPAALFKTVNKPKLGHSVPQKQFAASAAKAETPIAAAEFEVFVCDIPVSIGVHGVDEFGLQALNVATQVGELGVLGSSCQGLPPLLPPVPPLGLLSQASKKKKEKTAGKRKKKQGKNWKKKEKDERRRRRMKELLLSKKKGEGDEKQKKEEA